MSPFQAGVQGCWLDTSSQFAGTVAGLAPGNYLDLADQSYQGNNAPTYNSTGANTGTLAVTEGASTINIALLGSYLASSFVASSDGHRSAILRSAPDYCVLLGHNWHALGRKRFPRLIRSLRRLKYFRSKIGRARNGDEVSSERDNPRAVDQGADRPDGCFSFTGSE